MVNTGTGGLRAEPFERAGYLVVPRRRLGELVRRRPPGITAHQWASAIRTPVAFVAYRPGDDPTPLLALDLRAPASGAAGAAHADRACAAVCDAAGLELLRIESSALGAPVPARRLAEYVLDARAYRAAGEEVAAAELAGVHGHGGAVPGRRATDGGDDSGDVALTYRDILGRLPDGRTGFVNDLSTVARAAAIDAYGNRQLTDPTIRGLYVQWRDGTVEGWAWLAVQESRCLFERARIWQRGPSCAVDPGRLAEDLAAAAVGERLKALDTVASLLRERDDVAREFEALRTRRDEMAGEFRFDHITFD